jgi:adenylate cyclase
MTCPACAAINAPSDSFCRSCGFRLLGISIERERRLVVATVLFADMTGSTAMGERMNPEDVQWIMDHFYRELASCVTRYGGTVDKFLGDGIMATFGARHSHEDDPERALATALDMKVRVDVVNKRLAERLPHPIGLHIGINTGPVVTGSVGDESSHSEFTVIGDAVNLAARLEDLSEDGQILVSSSTYEATKHAYDFDTNLPEVRVKGKSEPIKVYTLKGRLKRRLRRRAEVESPFIGRAREMQLLGTALTRLVEGYGGIVAVTGPAGIGKSRLLDEARKASTDRPVRWVDAVCASPGLGGTLSVWAEAVSRLLNPSGMIKKRKSIAQRFSSGTTSMNLAEARDASAALAQLLHLDLTDEERRRMSALDDEALRDRLFRGVRDVIEQDAATGPLVLRLDDLHWCDSASMQLLAYVLECTVRVPLLVITDYRSEVAAIQEPLDEAIAKAAPPFRLTVEVQPLSDAESMELATALLGADPDKEADRLTLVRLAEGNPLFLEEVKQSIDHQHEQRLKHQDDPSRPQDAGEAIVIPDSLKGLLLDRIDRLPGGARQLIQIASVIGRVFSVELLKHISGDPDPSLLLGTLEQAGIIERVGRESGGTYRFRQNLMQEAAYSSLLLRRRAAYHRSTAEWYERTQAGPQPPPDLATILAFHWERGDAWAFAGKWALRAADEARRNFALDEAKEWYRKAWSAAERAADVEVRRAAEQGLGEIDFAKGDLEGTLRHFDAALALAREPLDRAVIERRKGQALDRDGQTGAALGAFARAGASLGEARPDDPPDWMAERARLGVARAFVHLRRGEDVLARSAAEDALRLEELPEIDRSDLTRLLGEEALRRGDDERAIAHFRSAQQLARNYQDVAREAAALEYLARAYLHRGQRNSARVHLEECLHLLRDRLRDRAGSGRVLLELAGLDEQAGVLRAAAAQLREAVACAEQSAEPVLAATARLRLGRVLRLLGNWQEAQTVLQRAGTDDPEVAGRAALELSLLALRRGDLPEAPLRTALDQGQRFGLPDLTAHARLGLAFLARRQGRRDEARAYLREVLLAANGHENETTTEARIALVELMMDDGRPEMAVTNARRALEEAERTGPALLIVSARRALGAALGAAGNRGEAELQLRRATEAARAAQAFPELARCLADWMRARGGLPGAATTDMEAHNLFVEMREVLAFLARGGAPRADDPPIDERTLPPSTPTPAGAAPWPGERM